MMVLKLPTVSNIPPSLLSVFFVVGIKDSVSKGDGLSVDIGSVLWEDAVTFVGEYDAFRNVLDGIVLGDMVKNGDSVGASDAGN